MTTFFSAIQGKFKAEFHGRYLGHILEQIAATRPEVIDPILKRALKKMPSRWAVRSVSTETNYLFSGNHSLDAEEIARRQADIEISLTEDSYSARVIVEIKMMDKFLDGQLEQYIDWAQRRNDDKCREDRAVVVLSAYPLDVKSQLLIDDNPSYISHMYLSDLANDLNGSIENSELISLLKEYLTEEGYAMYQLPDDKDGSDYRAFHSFMVLNFLPHESGHGKVATQEKISRGPLIFSHLVQNWQLVSERLAYLLKFKRIPTIRYFPQQAGSTNFDGDDFLESKRMIRKQKEWGRYWLSADCVCEKGLNVEWGQILEIRKGSEQDDEEPIRCGIYALIRKDRKQLAWSDIVWLKNGIRQRDLYSPELFMKLLNTSIDTAVAAALKELPDIKDRFPWMLAEPS